MSRAREAQQYETRLSNRHRLLRLPTSSWCRSGPLSLGLGIAFPALLRRRCTTCARGSPSVLSGVAALALPGSEGGARAATHRSISSRIFSGSVAPALLWSRCRTGMPTRATIFATLVKWISEIRSCWPHLFPSAWGAWGQMLLTCFWRIRACEASPLRLVAARRLLASTACAFCMHPLVIRQSLRSPVGTREMRRTANLHTAVTNRSRPRFFCANALTCLGLARRRLRGVRRPFANFSSSSSRENR
mmetsp:Transcript_136132/g.236602  ORF Transcript_136132/g.236602 Transcript_136132/m.236602 type:complete len:247 (+) Transcript_136132:254-994(+)